jgi:phytoene dehydrogenase-like protein
MERITVIGGGLAGLTAAIAAAEQGAQVQLLEAHDAVGGRARSAGGPYRANLGPHVIYRDGAMWTWLRERRLLPPVAGPPLTGIRVRREGTVRRTPPLGAIPVMLRLRGREAPVDRSFHDWVAGHADEATTDMLCAAAGVYTFFHDPGSLSAAFLWPRMVRLLLNPPPANRYLVGGWGALVDRLSDRAGQLGVTVRTGERVDTLPGGVVIVATELADARRLLADDTLRWQSGRTLCLDLGLRSRRGDLFAMVDLDGAGFVERFTAADRTLAPAGEELVQAQMPIRDGETPDRAGARLESLVDLAFPDRHERETWRRRQVMDGRSGALDLPGQTWRDRPAVDRGDGVFLAGDMVAAPGLLAEVASASGAQAGVAAAALAGSARAIRPPARATGAAAPAAA